MHLRAIHVSEWRLDTILECEQTWARNEILVQEKDKGRGVLFLSRYLEKERNWALCRNITISCQCDGDIGFYAGTSLLHKRGGGGGNFSCGNGKVMLIRHTRTYVRCSIERYIWTLTSLLRQLGLVRYLNSENLTVNLTRQCAIITRHHDSVWNYICQTLILRGQ